MQPIVTTIDLFRHGEVQGGPYYRGSTDDPLTEKGWQQMRKAVAEHNDWQVIITSPLCRCLDFAQKLSGEREISLITELGFQEINFGDWEAKTADQIEQIQPDALRRFYEDPFSYPPLNGESLPVFQQRIEAAWQQVLKNQQGKSILIVTHAGVIRTLFCLLLKIPLVHSFAITVEHASFTRFSCFDSKNGVFNQLNFHNRIR